MRKLNTFLFGQKKQETLEKISKKLQNQNSSGTNVVQNVNVEIDKEISFKAISIFVLVLADHHNHVNYLVC